MTRGKVHFRICVTPSLNVVCRAARASRIIRTRKPSGSVMRTADPPSSVPHEVPHDKWGRLHMIARWQDFRYTTWLSGATELGNESCGAQV